jgi:hypothetical protein
MTYDKQKALQILDTIIKNEQNENVRVAADDIRYALSLALVAYTEHLMHWSDIPEHSNQDTKEYFAALHNIHAKLTQAGIFSIDADESTNLLTD